MSAPLYNFYKISKNVLRGFYDKPVPFGKGNRALYVRWSDYPWPGLKLAPSPINWSNATSDVVAFFPHWRIWSSSVDPCFQLGRGLCTSNHPSVLASQVAWIAGESQFSVYSTLLTIPTSLSRVTFTTKALFKTANHASSTMVNHSRVRLASQTPLPANFSHGWNCTCSFPNL